MEETLDPPKISVRCPQCGGQIKRKLRRMRGETELECDRCGHVLLTDSQEVQREVRRAKRSAREAANRA